jgi:hypothetical protein
MRLFQYWTNDIHWLQDSTPTADDWAQLIATDSDYDGW